MKNWIYAVQSIQRINSKQASVHWIPLAANIALQSFDNLVSCWEMVLMHLLVQGNFTAQLATHIVRCIMSASNMLGKTKFNNHSLAMRTFDALVSICKVIIEQLLCLKTVHAFWIVAFELFSIVHFLDVPVQTTKCQKMNFAYFAPRSNFLFICDPNSNKWMIYWNVPNLFRRLCGLYGLFGSSILYPFQVGSSEFSSLSSSLLNGTIISLIFPKILTLNAWFTCSLSISLISFSLFSVFRRYQAVADFRLVFLHFPESTVLF